MNHPSGSAYKRVPNEVDAHGGHREQMRREFEALSDELAEAEAAKTPARRKLEQQGEAVLWLVGCGMLIYYIDFFPTVFMDARVKK